MFVCLAVRRGGLRSELGASRRARGRGRRAGGRADGDRRAAGQAVSFTGSLEHRAEARVEHVQQPRHDRVVRAIDRWNARLWLRRSDQRRGALRLRPRGLRWVQRDSWARAVRFSHGDLSVLGRRALVHVSVEQSERRVRPPNGPQLLLEREFVVAGRTRAKPVVPTLPQWRRTRLRGLAPLRMGV